MMESTRMKRRLSGRSLATLAVLVVFTAGCSDNPVDTGDQPVCDHIDADGLVVEHDDGGDIETLASQWQGNVVGEIELDEGEPLAGLRITFLDADSARIVVDPECVDHALGWTIADTNIVQAEHGDERWSVDLVPRAAGETTIRFRVVHGDHPDFTSLAFDIHVHEHDHEHAEAEGLILRRDGIDLATVWQGAVTGQVEVAAGSETHPIEVVLLDADEDEFTPHGDEFTMDLVIDDTGLAGSTVTGDWEFTVNGISEGATSLTVSVIHEGHADFTSPAIPVAVLAAATMPEALAVLEGSTHLVSWNHDGDHAAAAEGALVLDVGEERTNLAVQLLGEWIEEPGHGGSHRDAVSLPNGRYQLVLLVADPAVATLEHVPGDLWSLRASGVAAGTTSVVARLQDGDVTVLETDPLPIVVAAAGAGDSEADYFLKKNGVRISYVVDDQLVSRPEGCAAPAVGQLEAGVGEETDLFLLKYLAAGCGQEDVPGGRILSFRVADPAIASVTSHPIHWGERTDFHVRGLTAGETTVQMYLLNESTLEIELVSPELPVVIAAP